MRAGSGAVGTRVRSAAGAVMRSSFGRDTGALPRSSGGPRATIPLGPVIGGAGCGAAAAIVCGGTHGDNPGTSPARAQRPFVTSGLQGGRPW